MDHTVAIAICAGFLQVLGYIAYGAKTLSKETDPNPISWVMWGYGTLVLTILEADQGADGWLLVLPIVCASMSALAAIICFVYGKVKWPKNWQDQLAFILDLILTVLYLLVWGLLKIGFINEHNRELASLVFLLCSNATSFTSYWPTMRAVWSRKTDDTEHPLPWFVWGLAYTSLGLATFLENGLWTFFMLYPVINLGLCLTVAFAYVLHMKKDVKVM